MICEVFGCTPSEAEEQDLSLVHAILEYRQVAEVLRIEQSGTDAEKQYMASHPEMAAALERLHQTQKTLYEHPALTAAVGAVRQAEKERAHGG